MIRLYRVLPLIVVLLIIAVVVYLIMSFRYSSEKAKALMIKIFFWIFIVLLAIFGILTAYALFDHNVAVGELFGSCLAIAIFGLCVTLICRAIFRKNHPHYGEKVTEATFVNDSFLSKLGKAFTQAFGEALKDVFNPNKRNKS